VYINNDLLTKDELDAANAYLSGCKWNYGWKSNVNVDYGHWNTDITNTVHTNPIDVSDKLPFELTHMWEKIKQVIFGGEAILTRCYANRHTFGTEGYIHTDTDRDEDQTVVVYMNETWDPMWGGETVFYKDNEILNAVLPVYGRIVVFPGKVPHKAAPLSRICREVRTTLMFKVTIDPKPMDHDEEKLKKFLLSYQTDKIPHRVGSLFDHLYRCYHILYSMGASKEVCLAGGLHSIFGTNVFKENPDVSEEEVESLFGSRVFNLVRLFSTINRPHVLENPDQVLSDKNLFDLRCIECANLYDQSELNEMSYPNLYKFAKELRK
jgi:SM-20-related protein